MLISLTIPFLSYAVDSSDPTIASWLAFSHSFVHSSHRNYILLEMYSCLALSLLALSPLGALALPQGHPGAIRSSKPNRDLDGSVWKDLGKAARNKRQSSWNPPADLVKPLEEVWDHSVKTYNNGDWEAFKNYGYDIITAAEG